MGSYTAAATVFSHPSYGSTPVTQPATNPQPTTSTPTHRATNTIIIHKLQKQYFIKEECIFWV